jgi:hypothetical protein
VNSSPAPRLTSSRNAELIAHYEQLRQQVLGRSRATSWAQGLALLMRAGMKAWMQAWDHCSANAPAKSQDALGCEQIITQAMHSEVISILTAMALSGRQEIRA